MSTGFLITGVTKETVKALQKAVVAVLNAPHADEKTKQRALAMLAKGVTAPSNVSVSHCNITMPHLQCGAPDAPEED